MQEFNNMKTNQCQGGMDDLLQLVIFRHKGFPTKEQHTYLYKNTLVTKKVNLNKFVRTRKQPREQTEDAEEEEDG